MPKIARELSAVSVNRLTQPGLHMVGGVAGLGLQVEGAGARSWILRVSVGGKRRDIGLGGYPSLTLAGARESARVIREKIRNGVDPVAERRQARSALAARHARAITFQDAANQYIAAHEAGWKNPKHVQQWRNTLEQYAGPIMGKLQVSDVEQAHVLAVLEPIWHKKNETASRLRGRIEAILAWASVRGFRTGGNPAAWKGRLSALLPAPGKVQRSTSKHFAALPYAKVSDFMAELEKREGMAAIALRFAILTAARSGEVRGASWAEIDLAARLWIIPANRMKAGKEHRVPLSDASVILLKQLPHRDGLVFPAPRGGQLSDMSLTALLRRMEAGVTAHGFRSTFRDWAGETTNFPREVIEHALAHMLKDESEAAYARGDLLTKRAKLMQEWARYCTGPAKAAAVVSIRNAKK